MGKNRIKTVTAGRLVYAVCYSQPMASDAPAERAAKSRASSAARQKINFRAAWQRLELELAANFSGSACWGNTAAAAGNSNISITRNPSRMTPAPPGGSITTSC